MGSRTRLSDLPGIKARRVCVIKPSALGDVVQALPLLPVLRERFPEASIAWVINRELAEILEGHDGLDEIIPVDRRGGVWKWLRLCGDLRRRRFDLVFDLQGLARTGLLTAATWAPLRIGLESAREGASLACHWSLPDSGRLVPAHVRYWRVAEALDRGERRRETCIAVSSAEAHWAGHVLAELERPVLCVHAGARWKTKRWPLEKFAVIAARSARRFNFAVALVGSRDERFEAARLEHLLCRFAPAARVVNLVGQTTLKRLAAVLAAADLMLSNDSGPMHLAAGLGTPVVGIFSCTDPIRSGPPGAAHELVSTRLSCGGSYRKRCPYRGRKHLACMEEIDVERVWRAFERAVARQRRGRQAA